MLNTKKPVLAIMRPSVYIEDSVTLATSMGFEVKAVPVVELINNLDSSFNPFFQDIVKKNFDYVIFTSANGLDFTLKKIPSVMRDLFIDALNKINVVAIGPSTKKALERSGVNVIGLPDVYSSTGLIKFLCNDVKGKKIGMARSVFASDVLMNGLLKCGAEIIETKVYSLYKPDSQEQQNLIKSAVANEIDAFAFTSTMMVHNFLELADEQGLKEEVIKKLNNSVLCAIGKPTAQTLEGYGIKVSAIPEEYTFEEVLKTIKNML